jgi:hypothetical protein
LWRDLSKSLDEVEQKIAGLTNRLASRTPRRPSGATAELYAEPLADFLRTAPGAKRVVIAGSTGGAERRWAIWTSW